MEEQVRSRLENGLATRPDLLEATAARAQADYDLQAAIGAEDIAHGELATTMGLPPQTEFVVEAIDKLQPPAAMADSVDKEIDRAAAHVLGSSGLPQQTIDFFPYGYDERQYNSPGFRLAVGSLMRGRHGQFSEYHTSADNLEFVSGERK